MLAMASVPKLSKSLSWHSQHATSIATQCRDTSLLALYTCCHVDAPAVSINLFMQQGLLAAIVLKPDGSQDDHAYAILGDVHQRCIVFDTGQVY